MFAVLRSSLSLISASSASISLTLHLCVFLFCCLFSCCGVVAASPFPSDSAGNAMARPAFLDDKRCDACGKIINDEFVKLGKKVFHATCIKCTSCTKQISINEASVNKVRPSYTIRLEMD